MLRLRIRFPDGQSKTLDSISADTTFTQFREELFAMCSLHAMRLLLAGPPPQPLDVADDATLGSALRSGDMILVTCAENKTISTTPNPKALSTAKGTRPTPHPSQGPGNRGVKTDHGRVRQKRALAFKCAGPGQSLGGGTGDQHRMPNEGTSSGDTSLVVVEQRDHEQGCDSGQAGDMFGAIGVGLLRAVSGGTDRASKKARQSLKLIREEREREAEGERRYAAFLSGKYEFEYFRLHGHDGLTFRVKYLAPGMRKWREDPEKDDDVYAAWSVTLLGAVIQHVLEDSEQQGLTTGNRTNDSAAASSSAESTAQDGKEGLRARVMAHRSPRMFWNLVRHFGQDMESKMRELVPDADWNFLNARRRSLSEKAKENLRNEQLFKRSGIK